MEFGNSRLRESPIRNAKAELERPMKAGEHESSGQRQELKQGTRAGGRGRQGYPKEL